MYTMMQVCRETDMTYQTLKYYCNEGLIPNVKRDKNNRRVFDEHDVKWIKDLVCLKKCGMSIQEMKEYLQLCLQGEATIPDVRNCWPKYKKSCGHRSGNWKTASHTSTSSKTFIAMCVPGRSLMSAI